MIMKFDLCHLAVIDDGTPFKGGFVAMCKGVDLNNDILVKRNHKGLTVKDLLSFLNKAVIIVMEDRQSNDVFIPDGTATGCGWNLIYYAVLLLLAVNFICSSTTHPEQCSINY